MFAHVVASSADPEILSAAKPDKPRRSGPGDDPPTGAQEVAVLLGQHYGDGSVYLLGARDRILLEQAVRDGLVSAQGYLTPAGQQIWLRAQMVMNA